ncbi:MAG: uroporphyrinogen-III C-methyltransferase [Chloroflexi bacterium]|nr:uroporphyrinogen-III C-methyltransferase [Chloroflexota bacterium]
MTAGIVYLVGAGPGDPRLVTQKGVECLRQADVVIYDHLLDEALLSFVPATAEKIYVGKTGHEHAKEQTEINQLLVEKASQGKTVVRLKGGDPFVFGRGGEEAEVLVENNVPFEVVPGVTSAVAVPAYAGIPVTHRGIASSFAVITGHEDPTKPGSSLHWEKLATGVDTLVFLMGMQNLPEIVEKLITHGRPPDTPIAVIKDGTRPEQQTVVGVLADIVAKTRQQGLTSPAIIVVGQVVRLRQKLRWFDNRPLFGKRVLVTRARAQASQLSCLLAERGAVPVELPVIDIRSVDKNDHLRRAILNLKQYHWLVFTSVNGVEAFFQQLRELRLDTRALNGLKIGVIGPATAASLGNKGVVADYVPAVYTSRGFLEGLQNRDIAGRNFLLARADIADKELSEGLVKLEAKVDDIAVYKTVSSDVFSAVKKPLRADEIDVITFTSSSTVTNLIALLDNKLPVLNGTVVACIGPKTAETAIRAGLKVNVIAAESTIPGLVAAIEAHFKKEK